ncbi:hypothetical protein INQ28_26415, partial [Escherichia coli]|nr:hypothetical protein [Escherichia coli]
MMLPDRLRPRSVTGLAGLFGLVCALASVAIGKALYVLADLAFNRVQDAR